MARGIAMTTTLAVCLAWPSAALATMPDLSRVPIPAHREQTAGADEDVAQSEGEIDTSDELVAIRSYFAAKGRPALVRAQSLLAAYGAYNGNLDGVWGDQTAAAFNAVLQRYIAIGGDDSDWGITAPTQTPRLLDWIAEAASATANGTEYPD